MTLSLSALLAQLLIGLINGAFYATLSLGLAVIFGMLNVVNFAHGTFYMLGALCAWMLLTYFGIGYWPALIIAPIAVAIFGGILEWLFIRRTYGLDPQYGLLLTFGMALVIEGVFRWKYGTGGQPYNIPSNLQGVINLHFMYVPIYRGWVILASLVVSFGTWFLVERTRLGSYLRAAMENAALVRAFGINVPRMLMITYASGVGLAALAGVMAAPIYQVSTAMGSNIIVIVFAIVVIGGMGSLMGAIVSGFGLGLIEGLTKVFYPEASSTVIFVVMTIVLLIRPSGLFGWSGQPQASVDDVLKPQDAHIPGGRWMMAILLFIAVAAPFIFYPGFLMVMLCFALFACAFALLAGFVGLLSFGHAAFFGTACYVTAYAMRSWAVPPEIGLLLGTGAATLLGLGFGWLSIRRQGIYFAMVTLALAQLIYFVAVEAKFTGGEDGIENVPRGWLFGLFNLSNPL